MLNQNIFKERLLFYDTSRPTSFHKKIKFNFKGGDLTSDAGLLLIQEFMHHVKFPELLKQHFHLETDQAIRTHTNHELCLQQIFQTIAGYHCADDADE